MPFGPLILSAEGSVVSGHGWSLRQGFAEPPCHTCSPSPTYRLLAGDASADLLPGLLLKRGQSSVSEGCALPCGSSWHVGLQVPCPAPVQVALGEQPRQTAAWLGV